MEGAGFVTVDVLYREPNCDFPPSSSTNGLSGDAGEDLIAVSPHYLRRKQSRCVGFAPAESNPKTTHRLSPHGQAEPHPYPNYFGSCHSPNGLSSQVAGSPVPSDHIKLRVVRVGKRFKSFSIRVSRTRTTRVKFEVYRVHLNEGGYRRVKRILKRLPSIPGCCSLRALRPSVDLPT